jgi:hypothetical protein
LSGHDREEKPSRATGLIIWICQRIADTKNVRYHSISYAMPFSNCFQWTNPHHFPY